MTNRQPTDQFFLVVNGDDLLLTLDECSEVLGISYAEAVETFKDNLPIVGNEAISAEHICTTQNAHNRKMIVTMKVTAPKFLDGEPRAHRWFSQNSSSSRAIPVTRTLEKGYYVPDDIRVAQSGMQGYVVLPEEDVHQYRTRMAKLGEQMYYLVKQNKDRIHKQHLNRYLEPWTLQTKNITGGEEAYDHFFSLRCAGDADPAIYNLAHKVRDVYHNAIAAPKVRAPDIQDWHLPFITEEERDTYSITELMHASAARCARVSYNNFDNTSPDIEKDITLARMLESGRHASPFEHVAVPSSKPGLNGNLPEGFVQLRKTMNI